MAQHYLARQVIRIDLTTLRIFLAVYNLQSLTRAAEQEHIAPSAVSKRIQDLEIELDAQLFYRHPRGVTVTPAGEVLVAHAKRIFENVNQMAADLSAYAQGVKGQVRVHAHTSAVVQYLPAEIAGFSRRYPEVQVILREETSPNVLQSTLDGLADIGIFAGNMQAPAGLKVLAHRQDCLVALVPAGHPLRRARRSTSWRSATAPMSASRPEARSRPFSPTPPRRWASRSTRASR